MTEKNDYFKMGENAGAKLIAKGPGFGEGCKIAGNVIGSIRVQHRGDNEGLPTKEILQAHMAG